MKYELPLSETESPRMRPELLVFFERDELTREKGGGISRRPSESGSLGMERKIMDTVKAVELRAIVWNAVCDYTKKRLAAGKPASPSVGFVHAGLMVYVINEVSSVIPDIDELQKVGEPPVDMDAVRSEYLFIALAEVENGSALRQKLSSEKVGILPRETSKSASIIGDYL